jgi:hypothetical protein
MKLQSICIGPRDALLFVYCLLTLLSTHSFLQDLACKSCGEKLGLRCDNAPASHILIK